MAFWSDAQIEPKRKFKFIVTISGKTDNTTIPSFVVKKVTKPSFTISEGTHQFLGNKFYYPGKLEWNAIDLTLVDSGGFNEGETAEGQVGTAASGRQDVDITRKILNILEQFGYQDPDGTGTALTSGFNNGSLKTFSKRAGTTTVPSIQIQQLDSNGSVIEAWTLNNAWIKEVNFGELDYTSEDHVEITLKIRYDWATFGTEPLTQ